MDVKLTGSKLCIFLQFSIGQNVCTASFFLGGGRQRLLQKCIFSPKIRVHGSTFWRKIYFNINKSNKSTMALTTTVIKNIYTKVQNWKEENYQFSAIFNCPKLFQCIFFQRTASDYFKKIPHEPKMRTHMAACWPKCIC